MIKNLINSKSDQNQITKIIKYKIIAEWSLPRKER